MDAFVFTEKNSETMGFYDQGDLPRYAKLSADIPAARYGESLVEGLRVHELAQEPRVRPKLTDRPG
jgi:hypothetical protein